MLRLILTSARGHLVRFLLTAFSVMLGVSFVTGTFVLSDSIDTALQGLLTNTQKGLDVGVRGIDAKTNNASGSRAALPLTLQQNLAAVPGVRCCSARGMVVSIRCGHCHRKHESVAAVERCARGQLDSTRADTGHAVQVAKPDPATVGLYRKLGQIYAVDYWGGSGRLVAKRLDRYEDSEGRTAYRMVSSPGMATRLSQADRLDRATAAEFGRLTGTCIRCARPLHLAKSVAAGIGPHCAKKI